MITRRTAIAAGSAMLATPAVGLPSRTAFPAGFFWGAATAGHQVEGNDVNDDVWFLENVQPTIFAEQSGDADNSFELWATDLDLAKSLSLNTYRFSLEWARIEPEPGLYSIAMLDHYKNIIDACRGARASPAGDLQSLHDRRSGSRVALAGSIPNLRSSSRASAIARPATSAPESAMR